MVSGVKDEGAGGLIGIGGRRRNASDDGLEKFEHSLAGFGRNAEDVCFGQAKGLDDVEGNGVEVGGGEINLVKDWNDF